MLKWLTTALIQVQAAVPEIILSEWEAAIVLS